MAKVIITLEDTPDGGATANTVFEPRWNNPAFGGEETRAQQLGMILMEALSTIAAPGSEKFDGGSHDPESN